MIDTNWVEMGANVRQRVIRGGLPVPARYGRPSSWGVKKADRLYRLKGWLRSDPSELDHIRKGGV